MNRDNSDKLLICLECIWHWVIDHYGRGPTDSGIILASLSKRMLPVNTKSMLSLIKYELITKATVALAYHTLAYPLINKSNTHNKVMPKYQYGIPLWNWQ